MCPQRMALQLFEPLKKALMVTPITFITNPHSRAEKKNHLK